MGNMMLAFTIVWTYTSFCQFIIIWSGNIPEEASWYVHRVTGGWEVIAVLLALFHFFLPLLFLLQRPVKREPRTLATLAMVMLVVHMFNIWWTIVPTYRAEHFAVHWLDLVAPLAIGGIWVAYFIVQLKGKPLLPRRDPRFLEAFANEHH